jgi:hypothetical protein
MLLNDLRGGPGGFAETTFDTLGRLNIIPPAGRCPRIAGADESNNLNASGALSFSDVDLSDTHSVAEVTASSRALGTLMASVTTGMSHTTGGRTLLSVHYCSLSMPSMPPTESTRPLP